MFHSEHRVIHCLVTYTDWWQPATSSVLQVGAARRDANHYDGFGSGLLDTLDERSEICRRVWRLEERDRHLLFLWYVEQIPVDAISRRLGISRRQCFRRRGRAIESLVDRPDQAA